MKFHVGIRLALQCHIGVGQVRTLVEVHHKTAHDYLVVKFAEGVEREMKNPLLGWLCREEAMND